MWSPHLSGPYCSWQTPSSHQLRHEQLWDQAQGIASHIQIEFKWLAGIKGRYLFATSTGEGHCCLVQECSRTADLFKYCCKTVHRKVEKSLLSDIWTRAWEPVQTIIFKPISIMLKYCTPNAKVGSKHTAQTPRLFYITSQPMYVGIFTHEKTYLLCTIFWCRIPWYRCETSCHQVEL
jgi:hypothetical protein